MSIEIREDDLTFLLNLVRTPGQIRELSGQNNNPHNPLLGAADTPFTRLTSADYVNDDFVTPRGYVEDPAPGDPKYIDDVSDNIPTPDEIRDAIIDQEGMNTVNDRGANAWFTAFGQYVDHGLDFVIKGGDGKIQVGGNGGSITRASLIDHDNDSNTPEVQINNTAQFTDLSQSYGSHASMNAFLREYDSSGNQTAKLLSGATDFDGLSNLATWADVKANAALIGVVLTDQDVFDAPVLRTNAFGKLLYTPGGPYDTTTAIPGPQAADDPFVRDLAGNVLRSGQPFLIDFAPFAAPRPGLSPDNNGTADFGVNPGPGLYDVELLDLHFITGDGRGNENPGLTAVHTIWEREHNRLVEQVQAALEEHGFTYTTDELFNVVKIINEAQYQRTVFDEFVKTMLGGISGSGQHGFGGYDPTVDPSISHEFAGAAYRFGHSLLNETFKFVDANGNEVSVPLANLFVNPEVLQDGTTDASNVQALIRGLTMETAQEVDENLVDSMRDFVGGINLARGRDLGLPPLNQVRAELFALTGDSSLKPYEDWEEFGDNLLNPSALAAFQAVYDTVDDVDLYIGGLAEKHEGESMLGSTFHFIVTATFDALQDGDRFYYLDRLDGAHILSEINSQRFSKIVAQNTGIEDLPDDIFEYDVDDPWSGEVYVSDASPTKGQTLTAGNTLADADVPGGVNVTYQWRSSNNGGLTWTNIQGATGAQFTPTQAQVGLLLLVAATYTDSFGTNEILSGPTDVVGELYNGTASANSPILTAGADIASGLGGNDVLNGLAGDDVLNGNEGADTLNGDLGNDLLNGGNGADNMSGGIGDDTYVVNTTTDNITENSAEGIDTVRSSVSFSLAGHANIENMTLTGSSNINAEGNGLENILSGNSAQNALNGSAGNDTLNGVGGNDNLNGGAGDDTLNGGGGTDTARFNGPLFAPGSAAANYSFALNASNQVIVNDVRAGNPDGFDTLISVERLGFGSPGFNSPLLTLNAGTNVAETRTGTDPADLMLGFGGNDIMNANSGNDVVLGHEGNDTLNGNSGNDVVEGGNGDDVLNGGSGTDTLRGGAGIDNLNGGTGGDRLIGGDDADQINTGATNDNLQDIVLFGSVSEFGDTVVNFDANGNTAGDDRVEFTGLLNTAWDDGNNNDTILFTSGNNGAGNVNAAIGQNDGEVEALYLSGLGGEGVVTAALGDAAAVAAAFNAEFIIFAADTEDALLVINDTNGNSFATYQWIQDTATVGNDLEIDADELTLIATFTGNATATVDNFAFV